MPAQISRKLLLVRASNTTPGSLLYCFLSSPESNVSPSKLATFCRNSKVNWLMCVLTLIYLLLFFILHFQELQIHSILLFLLRWKKQRSVLMTAVEKELDTHLFCLGESVLHSSNLREKASEDKKEMTLWKANLFSEHFTSLTAVS